MHSTVMDYVGRWVLGQLGIQNGDTLEVGSYDVNGSVRPMFTGRYVGVDIMSGPRVDIIAEGANLPFPDKRFDTVVSTEMLEHDTRPWLSVSEMCRVIKQGGYLILTARGYDERGCYPIHDYPRDYWRYSVGGITELCEWAGLTMVDCIKDTSGGPGVFAVGRK